MAIISSFRKTLLPIFLCLVISSQLISGVHGAKAIYIFGDSYVDTGNANRSNDPLSWEQPYGMTWPGYPDGRASNGRNQADYIAKKFNLPSPIPIRKMNSTSDITEGVNFAVGGAGVTYAYGHATIHNQVDEFEALINSANIPKDHLVQSVAFINVGLNDYGTYSGDSEEISAGVDLIIDGLTYNVWRIGNLGVKNIMVTNIVPLACGPWATYINNFTACTTNQTFITETIQHNERLVKALGTLQEITPNVHVILLNQTRAMDYLLSTQSFRFVNTTVPCCHGWGEEGQWQCGRTKAPAYEEPLYKVCSNPNETFWWDQGHPSDAGSKALIDLYWSIVGFTCFGRNIESWIKRHNI